MIRGGGSYACPRSGCLLACPLQPDTSRREGSLVKSAVALIAWSRTAARVCTPSSRQPTGVLRRRCGSASGSGGERAELAARAARRAALTKARRYSIRFRDLREARITYRRSHDAGPEHGPIRAADHSDEETTLIIGTLTYAGIGWKTSGDALLANTAADQARKRRQAGHDELADQYNRATASIAA